MLQRYPRALQMGDVVVRVVTTHHAIVPVQHRSERIEHLQYLANRTRKHTRRTQMQRCMSNSCGTCTSRYYAFFWRQDTVKVVVRSEGYCWWCLFVCACLCDRAKCGRHNCRYQNICIGWIARVMHPRSGCDVRDAPCLAVHLLRGPQVQHLGIIPRASERARQDKWFGDDVRAAATSATGTFARTHALNKRHHATR